MDAEQLVARIRLSRAPAPEGAQLDLLVRLARLYAELGVLEGEPTPALHRTCPSAAACWSGRGNAQPQGVSSFDVASENGCMFLPWVGPRYRQGGVVVLGMNLRNSEGGDWEFGLEHRIARDPAWGQEVGLRAGHKAHGSNWSKGTMRDVAAVRRSWTGESGLDTRDGAELADALLSSARLQAIKCSPVGGRSSPTPAMAKNCPSRFLAHELGVLRPSVVLAYGAPAHAALAATGRVEVRATVSGFRRAHLVRGESAITAFLMTHPAHGRWHKAHGALIESLKRDPAGQP